MTYSFKKQLTFLPLVALGFCLVSLDAQAMDNDDQQDNAGIVVPQTPSPLTQLQDQIELQNSKCGTLTKDIEDLPLTPRQHFQSTINALRHKIQSVWNIWENFSQLTGSILYVKTTLAQEQNGVESLPQDDFRHAAIDDRVNRVSPCVAESEALSEVILSGIRSTLSDVESILNQLETQIKEYKLTQMR